MYQMAIQISFPRKEEMPLRRGGEGGGARRGGEGLRAPGARTFEPRHDKTNNLKCVCSKRRLRSAQSDQILRCPHEETLGP